MNARNSLRALSDENGTNGRNIENTPFVSVAPGAWKMVKYGSKRATFACLPNTFEGPRHEGVKPDVFVAPHIFACGDFVRGPYPATLEGAVRSGLQVVRHLS